MDDALLIARLLAAMDGGVMLTTEGQRVGRPRINATRVTMASRVVSQ
jgi:hypothetical protein